MMKIRAIVLVSAVALMAWGCQGAPEKYVRPSDGCKCAQMMGGPGKCKCNHCSGEAGSKCYCGTGGCACGMKMPKCQCGHCTGVSGGDDGKGGCSCGKK